jgi:O-antigen/teichoic acid export membrane protein
MAVKGSIAWMAGAQGSAFLLQFASTVFVARLLTPYDMGVFAVAGAIVGALALIQAFGLENMIIREPALTEDIIATTFSVNAMISLVLSALITGCAFLGGAFLRDPGVRQVLLLLAISPLIWIPAFLPGAHLERRGQFKVISIINTLKGLATSVSTIVFALMGLKYLSIAYAQLVGQLVGAGLFCWAGREFVTFKFGFKAFRATARFGIQMLAISGVTEVARRSSEIIMAKLLGLPALGIYSRGSGLNGLLWDKIHLVLGRVLFVDFAEHKRRGLSLRDKYLVTLEMITALLWPAFAGLAVLAGPFILVVYGAKWVPAATPLAFIAVASLIQVSITMTWEVFVASGELRTQMRIEFIRASVSLAMFAAGCAISLTTAAASRVADAIFAVVLYRPYLQRMTDTTLSDFLPIYLRSGILTALAILPGSALMIYYKGSAQAPISLALAATGLGVLLWLVGLILLQHPLIREGQAWLSRRRVPRETAPLEASVL